MQFLASRCIDKLDLRNSKTLNPIKRWKKNKAYDCFWKIVKVVQANY